MKLHQEDLSIVLIRETNNKHQIYLYPRCNGKAWIAYGQSAHNLYLLMPHIRILQQKAEGMSEPVAMLVVPQLSLEFLIEKEVDIRACDDGRNLKLILPREMRKGR